MRGLDYFCFRLTANYPRREQVTCKLGLRMPRGHVNYESLYLSVGNVLELLCNQLVVSACNKLGPYFSDVSQEIIPTAFYLLQLCQPKLKLESSFLNLWGLCVLHQEPLIAHCFT